MNLFKSLSTGQLASASRPRHRRLLFWVLNWYDAISAVIIFTILWLIVEPILPRYPIFLLWPLMYTVYICIKLVVSNSAQIDSLFMRMMETMPYTLLGIVRRWVASLATTESSAYRARFRAWPKPGTPYRLLIISLLLAPTVFIVSIRYAHAALGLPPMEDSGTWLLFGPPIWLMARRGNLKWIMSICGLACAANALTFVLAHASLSASTLQLVATQSLWLGLVCLLPIVLISYLSEREGGLNAAINLLEQVAGIRASSTQEFANSAALVIARVLGFPEIFILLATLDSDSEGKGLRLIGAASEAGRRLVKEGYLIPPRTEMPVGITTWAAIHKKYCLVNDVLRDPQRRYLPHEDFPHTKAELAVPIMIGNELIGVLDVQSGARYAFSRDDANLLRAITTHLAITLSNVQNLTRFNGLYSISQTITERLLSRQELRPVLEEIVTVAREVLSADVVVLYPHNPESKVIGDPVVVGKLHSHVSNAQNVYQSSSSAVLNAIEQGELQFNTYIRASTAQANGLGSVAGFRSDFVKREGIQSAAILPLRLGPRNFRSRAADATLGVVFVDYRKRHTFTSEYKDWCGALVDIAALALQNAFLYDRVIREERANLRFKIHDGLTQDANWTRMLLEQMTDTFEKTGQVNGIKLQTALASSQSLTRQINYLVESWRDSTNPCRLFAELERYAKLVQESLGIQCQCQFVGTDQALPLTIEHEITMVTREAVYNAARHGHANEISIDLHISPTALSLNVSDNGKGFDMRTLKVSDSHGISSIYHRTGRLGGTIDIKSEPRNGTVVSASIPLPVAVVC